VDFRNTLYDVTAGAWLAHDWHQSGSTRDESFTLGVMGGDTTNDIVGSLTGSLTAGHTYQWIWHDQMDAYPVSDEGAFATGDLSLTIERSVVPEPTTLTLLGLGLTTLLIRRRMVGRCAQRDL
jgi:hypothetical protein